MSRNPRIGARVGCGLTKTQQLRQARSSAALQEYEQKQDKFKRPEDPLRRRKYEKPEPKKVDFSKPTMTKTMLARMKQAEKFKQDYERKREETTHHPRRTPAPIGGDARMGKERIPKKPPSSSTFAASSRDPSARRREGPAIIPEKTCELARSMNADVIQAEPIGEGPIDSIIIPPGTVSDDRTTVISIAQPPLTTESSPSSQIANRSIQVISETLDEQDAVEAAAVQNRLTDLQQARREFVIAVANVGGNAVNVGDETRDPSRARIPRAHVQRPPVAQTPPRRLYRVPDVEEDDQFQIKYGLDHPDVVAAREFAQRTTAGIKEREAARRMEREFEKMGKLPPVDDLQLDVPFEQQLYQDEDISWEEDEETGMVLARPSKVKATMPRIPKRQEEYQYEPFEPEQLERFFDVQRYPPTPVCRPPPGRECLHPDLWELDDPWYRPPPEPDMPDLIEFD